MSNRAGEYKLNLSGAAKYKSFYPSPLPPQPPIVFDSDTMNVLINANKSIAILNNITNLIPDINLFVSMYVRKEALLTSQIEGTLATLEDVLDPSIDANSNRDVGEVINYIKALNFAIERLNDLPICNRLIREIHSVLMSGIRGQDKSPGDFRHTQNWIGGIGSTLSNASFIPPSPPTKDIKFSLLTCSLPHLSYKYSYMVLKGMVLKGSLSVRFYLKQSFIVTYNFLLGSNLVFEKKCFFP